MVRPPPICSREEWCSVQASRLVDSGVKTTDQESIHYWERTCCKIQLLYAPVGALTRFFFHCRGEESVQLPTPLE